MQNNRLSDFPYLGFGLGLRGDHLDDILSDSTESVDWFEVISENYMGLKGDGHSRGVQTLDQVAQKFPIVCHGVSLSLGSKDELNENYVVKLLKLIDRYQPRWVSDHLCWTGVHGEYAHDLLPMPYTEESIDWISEKILKLQDRLKKRILIENVSSYIEFNFTPMKEYEFLNAVLKKADCGLLLDVNNVYVSHFNHGIDPYDYLDSLPMERVGQIHLAGHTLTETHIVDTHDEDVIPEVWDLYRYAIKKIGPVSTMIERDDNIPPYQELCQELGIAKQIASEEWGNVS